LEENGLKCNFNFPPVDYGYDSVFVNRIGISSNQLKDDLNALFKLKQLNLFNEIWRIIRLELFQ
jgi:hypothetical protein